MCFQFSTSVQEMSGSCDSIQSKYVRILCSLPRDVKFRLPAASRGVPCQRQTGFSLNKNEANKVS